MVMVGHRTESIYQRYKVADEAMIKASATKLAALQEWQAFLAKWNPLLLEMKSVVLNPTANSAMK